MKRNILITGGAGFIGSHVVRLFVEKYPDYHIINLDKLTYAGNLANLKDIEDKPNYKFVKMDICDFEAFYQLMQDEKIDGIIHLAAESHVDRSIKDPFTFAKTNVMGTLALLQAAKLYWESLPERFQQKLFYHISTDEVYGSLPDDPNAYFYETTPYDPHSPYSASKASPSISLIVNLFHGYTSASNSKRQRFNFASQNVVLPFQFLAHHLCFFDICHRRRIVHHCCYQLTSVEFITVHVFH